MVSAFSIGKAKRTTYPASSTPGPGAYNPEKKQKQTPPTYRIGSSGRSGLLRVFAPGPGAYDPPGRVTKEGPRYTFGLKTPAEHIRAFAPGPGAYNPNYRTMIKALPLYSMAARLSSSQTSVPPGPGTYETKSTVLGVPCMRFPHSQRLGFYEQNKTPGPGTYANRRPGSAGPQYKFGTGSRGFIDFGKNPGPGTYEARTDFSSSQRKGFSMMSRRQDTQTTDRIPGPGTYNWDKQQKQRPPSYKIGHQNRGELDREALRTPGPGQYESRYEFARPKSAQVRIGSATRRPLNDAADVPGPGTYELQTKIGEGPKFQMLGSKYNPSQSQMMPGPGAYNPTDALAKQRPQSAKIGTGVRSDFTNNAGNAPGPGNYNLRGNSEGPRWGFGSAVRPPLSQTDRQVPGPGNYNIKSTVADVPHYLIPPK